MDDISGLFQKLQVSLADDGYTENHSTHPPVTELIDQLISLLQIAEESVINAQLTNLLKTIQNYFEKTSSDTETTASLLKFLAEVAKNEHLRDQCTVILPCVLKCLETDDAMIILQTLRAIGNISCDNNKARECVLNLGGVEKIVLKLKELYDLNGTDEIEKLQKTVCGSVLNLSLDNESLQKEVINFGAIPVLLGYMKENSQKTDLCFMIANTVSSLIDLEEGRISFINANGCKIFIDHLKASSDKMTSLLCECLMLLVDEDDVKLALVKENGVETLHEIILENTTVNDEDDKLIRKIKTAVDIIVLVLSNDDCLELLFNDKNSGLINKIISWNNSTIAYIRNSGPVAIGNVARTEVNCVKLVKMDVHKHLITLLKETQDWENKDDIQLHVSVLSALKNLVIPEMNKSVLIEAGMLDCTVELMLSQETPSPITYRAITVSRLLVQGQPTAVDKICSEETCIKNVISLADSSCIEALKSESARLLATLLKNARTSVSILSIVKNNGLHSVLSMITCTHLIMQNEALVAIVLTINALENNQLEKLDKDKLLSNIKCVFDAEKPEPQTCYNAIAVIEALFIKDITSKSKLEDNGILHGLEKITNHEHQSVKQRAVTVLKLIKDR